MAEIRAKTRRRPEAAVQNRPLSVEFNWNTTGKAALTGCKGISPRNVWVQKIEERIEKASASKPN
ncbi:hypothetical protein GCM10027299_44000 [Larkinella ripae]